MSHPYSDRLLMGSPLRRRGVCIVISAALSAVLAFAILINLGLILGAHPDIAAVFFRALFLSTLLATVPLALLWFLDRRERETPWLFAAAFLWGGCIATGLALPFNIAFFRLVDIWLAQHPAITQILGPDATIMLAAPISAPVTEEIGKALGVLLIFWLLRAEFDNMRDGLVYGALVGLGFNWFEAAMYVAQDYAEHGVATYGNQLGFRYGLFGLGGHALFTGIFGASLGLAIQTQSRFLRILAPVGGLILAMLAHMLNNVLPLITALTQPPGTAPTQRELAPDLGFLAAFMARSLMEIVVFSPLLLVLALALWRSGVWERRVIREELADEVGRSITPTEYDDVVADRMWRTRRIDRMHPRRSAALVNAQHELAFRKRRVKHEGHDPEQDSLVAGWREDIRRLRAAE